ncbi:Ger(x)C family spore germination protein [Ammoniphilus sp. YIM 78166]|uniref:Ger(x)C family spore germination protein n=1 Tax=Ammoniphilus sp. YIM 78166 TaxID=1644106 RepID=UPI00106F8DCE|nr:Ger(x)C family spore germination protein [Ammoniphilus sp. YIM 78166]
MHKEAAAICILICLLAVLTGCWDRVEIQERGFVLGVAIDESKDQQEGEGDEKEERTKGEGRYVVTHQFVAPEGLQGGDGGGGTTPFFNLTTEGASMIETVRMLATRTSRPPYFGHIKMIIISEDVAKKGRMADVVDFFLRDHEMRRGTKVMIAKGQAKDILNFKPPLEKTPVTFIRSVAENIDRTGRIYPPVRIGDLHELLLRQNSYALPRIMGEKEEVKVAGAAIFQGYSNRMVGWLGEEETIGLNCIRGEIKGGIEKVEVEDKLVVYEFRGKNSSIEVDVSDIENLKFTITMESEGFIPESQKTVDWLSATVVRSVEKKIGEETVRIATKALNKLHKEFKVDAIGLGRYLYTHHPKVWDKVKHDWDRGKNYFAKSTIELKGKAIVRNSGVIIKSEPIQE